MATVSVRGMTTGYGDEGTGEALVLVHGHPFDRSMWQPQVARFSRAGWRVITPDLRGYGESTAVPGKTPLATFARDIAALLDALGVGRIVLGGLSMGGQIVMEFQRLFPERLRGLVLAATSAAAETADGRMQRNTMADRILAEGISGYATEVLPRMVAPDNIRAMPQVADHVMDMMRGTSPVGAAAALRGRAERPDYTATLSHVAVPTLVVVGRQDSFTPVSDAETLYQRIPHATLVVIEDAAHLPNLERPAEFNDALAGFLATLPTSP